jgi:Kef-type K+ transport system membrane component KefB
LTEHQLLVFLVDVAALVLAARLGGEIAVRLGLAEVVGELAMGILLGPSLFGVVWPRGFAAVFPADPPQRNLLELVGWIGVLFLVTLSGFETRLSLLRRTGKVVGGGWIGGFVLPFVMGFGLGWLVPSELVGPNVARPVFALFLGTAMSISAIPVIARILLDLDLVHTRVGMVILSTAVADDTVGWIVLAVVTGFAAGHGFAVSTVVTALVGTLLFLVTALVIGGRLVRAALRASTRLRIPFGRTTVVLAIVLIGAAITQAIHVHLVLGAFVAAILVGRSGHLDQETRDVVRHVGVALFVPFFFAYTGLKVNLTTLTGRAIPIGIAAVVVACVGKLVGGSVGARLGGMAWDEAWAVGAGLNARGAMELVIAAIGLSIGVLTLPMYSIVVLIAIVTTLMAAPMLRRYRDRAIPGHIASPPRPSEAIAR